MNVSQLARQEAGLSLTSLLSEDGTHRWDAGDMAKEAQCLSPLLCALPAPPHLHPPPLCPALPRRPKSLRAAIDDSLRVLEGFRQEETTGLLFRVIGDG